MPVSSSESTPGFSMGPPVPLKNPAVRPGLRRSQAARAGAGGDGPLRVQKMQSIKDEAERPPPARVVGRGRAGEIHSRLSKAASTPRPRGRRGVPVMPGPGGAWLTRLRLGRGLCERARLRAILRPRRRWTAAPCSRRSRARDRGPGPSSRAHPNLAASGWAAGKRALSRGIF